MKRLLWVTWGFCMALAACGSPATVVPSQAPLPSPTATATPVPTPVGPFEYDNSVPFDTKVISETERDGATIVDLTYATHDPSFSSPTGGRTVAYLVKPQGEGSFAGMIFVHWLGTVSSNRSEYLEEAVALAKRGVVSLLPQGYFPWMSFPMGNAGDHQLMVAQIIELRRAIDFLISQARVDPARLGYVGHDYGALYGGVLAGTDPRLKTYVLVAGTPSFVDFGVIFGFKREEYAAVIGDLGPDVYVAKAAPASLFFQFGQQDSVVPEEKANQFYEAASQPKKIEWYADIHNMENAQAREARLQWLVEKLSLGTP